MPFGTIKAILKSAFEDMWMFTGEYYPLNINIFDICRDRDRAVFAFDSVVRI